ncbi:MAG TPA: hypothetical protein VHN20_13745 [Beijerinckiaceae bacterium]|nr:hypothetical protein [Beijerinckiaceae bacterium]
MQRIASDLSLARVVLSQAVVHHLHGDPEARVEIEIGEHAAQKKAGSIQAGRIPL